MEAVMLVGGKGTRLRPLTMSAPKPMLPIAGVPVISHMLARARDAGITHVVLATSYRAEVFEKHLGDGSDIGLELEYVTEEEPLGTGGAIRNVLGLLHAGPDDPVVVFNGDILSGIDIAALVRRHCEQDAAVTLHLTEVEDPRAFGVVVTDPDGWVMEFLEKAPQPRSKHVNAGCYVFRRSVIDTIATGRPVSVEHETFPGLLGAGTPVMSYLDSTYWLDLGTPEAFVRGSRDIVTGRVSSPALPGEPGSALLLPRASVAPDAVLCGGSVVGRGAVVGAAARLDGTVVFDGAAIHEGADISASVIGYGASIGARTCLAGVVVGDGATIGPDNELRHGARIFPNITIGAGSIRFSSDQR
jgi:mannose-1-phosphate guanylyltransferase